MLLLLRKKRGEKRAHAHNLLPVWTASGHGHFRSRDFVTSGQKTPIGQIWCNFRLRMGISYFRAGSLPVAWLTSPPVTSLPVTSLPVTSLPVAPHSTSANTTLSVPIYYWSLLITTLFEKGILPQIVYFHFSLLEKKTLLWFHWLPQGVWYSVENSLVEDSEKQSYKREDIHCCI